jgi:lipid II:glycine glycyltransferase (peptidoglycan interpeptide bridge formation enzyme)
VRGGEGGVGLKGELVRLKEALLASETNLLHANQTIECLNKTLKECKVNQKSMANLKNLQNQLDLLHHRNLKLSEENEHLAKSNRVLGVKGQQRDSTS